MKVIVSVQAKSGSSRGLVHYLAHSKTDEQRGEPPTREIFSECADQMTVEKANEFLQNGTAKKRAAAEDLHHIVISLKPEDYERLGGAETERQASVKKITRAAMDKLAAAVGAERLAWAAAIHRNTDNPHVHIGHHYYSLFETTSFEPSGDGGSIEENIQKLADASRGMFAPTDITWEYYSSGNRLSFKQNGRFYSIFVPRRSDYHNSPDQYRFYRFPPQILTAINQAIADAGYRSRYFILPMFGYDAKSFALVPKDAHQRAVQEKFIPEMPSPINELLELLVRIRVDLPKIDEDDLTDGDGYEESVWAKPRNESVWAKHIGDDLYEIRSVPLYAYNLHFNDVVKAVADSPDAQPKMLEVVTRSGHKTIRIKFADEAAETEKSRVLKELCKSGAVLRDRDETRYGLDFQPEADYQWVRDETERKEITENYRQLEYQKLLGEIQPLLWDRFLEYELGEQDNENSYVYGSEQGKLDFHYRLLEATRSNNYPLHEARALYKIGVIYQYTKGESQKAIDFLTQSAELSRKLGNHPYDFLERFSLENIGDIYYSENNYRKAIDFYKQTLLLLPYDDFKNKAEILMKIEHSYNLSGEKQNALEFYNQYLQTPRPSIERMDEHLVLIRLAFIYSSAGENHKALDFYQRSQRSSSHPFNTAEAPFNTFDLLGDKQNELGFFNRLLKTTREINDRAAEIRVLFYIAFVIRQSGNLEESLKQIEAAIAIIDSSRSLVISHEELVEYFISLRGCYTFYISLLTELHKLHLSEGYDAKARQADERRLKAHADG